MDIWIAASVAAALFQTVRFMLQKHLTQVSLSAAGATFARFVYSAPLAVATLVIWLSVGKAEIAQPGFEFWAFGAIGGGAQILATVCTVMLFGRRNFAVGLTFIKVEVLLTALIGFVVLGEGISKFGLLAIVVGVSGVLVLSGPMVRTGPLWRRFISPSAALGLTAGALFGVSAVCYRGASLAVSADDPFLRAMVTLAAATSMQMVAMAIWLRLRDRPQIGRVLSAWKTAGWIGLTSMAGSFCWFIAFTLQNAAYVKAVGQVELIFGILGTVLIFREKISPREWVGMALLVVSIMALMLAL